MVTVNEAAVLAAYNEALNAVAEAQATEEATLERELEACAAYCKERGYNDAKRAVFEAKTREIVEADSATAIEAAQLKLEEVAQFVEVVPDEAVAEDEPGETGETEAPKGGIY